MKWIVAALATLVLLLVLAAYGPGSLTAQKFEPSEPDPALEAMFDAPTQPAVRMAEELHGAEDLEPGPDGRLYGSLADGRIMALAEMGGWSEVANTGGRPLGLSFAPDGSLFIADALKGLLRLGAGGDFEVWLADESDGGPLVFTDDLTVLADGTVILTDASKRYGYGAHMDSFFEGEQTGVVYRVTAPGEYEALADGLAFINGVDHDPETGLVYINETWAGRVWMLDPNTEEMSVLIDGLPGYPDNLEFDPETGLIWIALPSPRSEELDSLHPTPFVKRLAWRWIQIAGLPPLPPTPAMALAVTTDGEPAYALYGPDDRGSGITTATPWSGAVYVAGLERDGVDAYSVPVELLAAAPPEDARALTLEGDITSGEPRAEIEGGGR
ncbi:MAG: SMP-30/gluconolactonase/LRE family protein [Oceanicaulis sp.]